MSAAASTLVHLSGLGYAVHLLTPETVQEGPDEVPIEPAAALSVLAVTEPDKGLALARLTRSGLGLLSGGGLLVAVLAAHDETALRSVATLRHPGATALAMVLDVGSFSGHGPTPGQALAAGAARGAVPAARAADLLRGAGWRATAVTAADSVADAWSRVGSARDARVGSGVTS